MFYAIFAPQQSNTMQTNVKSGLTAEIINEFKKIVGENNVFYDEETLDHYAHDETENLHYLPDVVIKPGTSEEISALMKICNAKKIPVTPRGAGTGLSGGALPHLGGCCVSNGKDEFNY